MTANDKDCSTSNLVTKKCKFSNYWVDGNYCQQSCFEEGNGYDNDNCCESTDTPTQTPTKTPSSFLSNKPSPTNTSMPSKVSTSQPSQMPSKEHSQPPSSLPTKCSPCDNRQTPSMFRNGINCEDSSQLQSKCNKNPWWSNNKFCQWSCFSIGNGYENYHCCEPSENPSKTPSSKPSNLPSFEPSMEQSKQPSIIPSSTPSVSPSAATSLKPSTSPYVDPIMMCSSYPSGSPLVYSSGTPSVDTTSAPF